MLPYLSDEQFEFIENVMQDRSLSTVDCFISGLNILKSYKPDLTLGGEHDIIWTDVADEVEISYEDCKLLYSFGFHFNGEVDCWCKYT